MNDEVEVVAVAADVTDVGALPVMVVMDLVAAAVVEGETLRVARPTTGSLWKTCRPRHPGRYLRHSDLPSRTP